MKIKSRETPPKKENYYRLLAESSRDIIITQSIDGEIVYVNPAWTKITGYSIEETRGKSVRKFIVPSQVDKADQRHKARANGEESDFVYEIEILGKSGKIIPLEVKSTPITNIPPRKQEFLFVARDIRKRKKTEDALQRQLNELNILQATAFTSTQATEENELIRQITNIIGNTLYPDNFGILLLHPQTQELRPHTSYQGISEKEALHLSRGITGKVASTGKSLRIADVRQNSEHEVFCPSTRSELCVPIEIRKEVLGVINIESSKENFFTADDERLLTTIARQTAISLEKIRLFQAEQKRRQIAEKLQKSAAILTRTLNKREATERILEELSQVVSFNSASIQLLNNGYLEIIGGLGKLVLKTEKDHIFPFPGNNPNTIVIQTKKHLILNEAPKTYTAFLQMPSILSWLGVPLIVQERPIGILTLDSDKYNHFTEEDARLVCSFANHAAIAIKNAELFNAEKEGHEKAETLRKTALAITASLNIKEAVQHILEQLSRVLPYDSASIQILRDGELELIGGRGEQNPAEIEGMRFPLDGTTPNTRVIRTKKAFVMQDAKEAYATFSLPPHTHIRAWMGVPLIIRNQVIGMLSVDSRQKGYFTKESAELAQSFASQAAIAVENARLFDAEQARRQEAETLRQAAHTISSSLDLDEVLDTILASIERTIPYDSAAIILFEKNKIKIAGGRNLPNSKTLIGKKFPRNSKLLDKIASQAHPLILNDAEKDPDFSNWSKASHVRSWMAMPLITRGKVIGYINLDSQKVGTYNEKDAELAQIFAHQAASAIENAHLYQKALQSAERHTILHKLSQDILRDIESPEKTYRAIHKATEKLMRSDAFVISLRSGGDDQDEAVYLIDKGRRYSTKKVSRESSLITLAKKMGGSFINKDLSTSDLNFQQNHFGAKEKTRSRLVSPMYVGKKIVGILSVQCYSPDIYGEEEKVLLEMLASHAASAIENARLFYETEERGREFAELYKITQDLVSSQELEIILGNTLKRAIELLGISSGDIYLYNKEKEKLIPVLNYGLPESYAEKVALTSLSVGEGIAGTVAKNLAPFSIDDYQAWEGKSSQFNDFSFTSVLGVPMLYAGNLIGVIDFHETHPHTRHFTDADKRIMTLFATQVAGAVHSAKQFKQLNHRLGEVEAVNRTSIALRNAKTLKEMLEVLLNEISYSLKIDVSAIWLDDSSTNEIYRAISCGWIKKIQPDRHANDIGLIGHIYQSGKVFRSEDLRSISQTFLPTGEEFPKNWTGAWIPIRSAASTIGVVAIMAELPREFYKEDIRLLTTLAEMFGNALHRVRLSEHTNKQMKRLTTYRNIDAAISANFDIELTLQLLIEHSIIQLDIDSADILLSSPTGENLTYFIGSGFKSSDFSKTDIPFTEGLLNKAIQEKKIQYPKGQQEKENFHRKEWFAKEDFHSYYCVPLKAKGKVLGVLEVFCREALNLSDEWEDVLKTLAGQAAIAIDRDYLFKGLEDSHEKLKIAYNTTLEGWGKALELRDRETQGHTINVSELTLQLAREMGCSDVELSNIYRGALLHDIGKMGIPDNILHKPGPLTKDEWKTMRQHPQFAYDMLAPIPYLLPVLDIPYCHHERWDGTGYPRGLQGKKIPLAARMFSIIDVWDALLTNRPYREAWQKQTVIDYIKNESGTRFDPEIVNIFLKMVDAK